MTDGLPVKLGWYREAALRPYAWGGAFLFFFRFPVDRKEFPGYVLA